MEKCRICLKQRRKVISIFDYHDKGLKYYDMIVALTNLKMFKTDTEDTSNKLCTICSNKLVEAYEFKLLIEKSYFILQNNISTKRILFNNLNDVKLEIEIPAYKSESPHLDITDKFQEIDDKSYIYKDINITKLECVKKEMHVDEFLDSIDNQEDFWNDNHDGYESDTNYLPPIKRKNRMKVKNQSNNKTKKTANKHDKENFICPVKPIKPVYNNNFRLKIECRPRMNGNKERKKRIKHLKVCPCCGKLVAYMKYHMFTHTGDKSFQCDKCPKTFYTRTLLNQHCKSIHSARTLKCDQCVASFTNAHTYKQHKELSHSDVKNCICDICSKAFKRKTHLKRHIELVHGIGAKQYPCESCPKVCKSKVSLRHHLRVHTGERPFKCEICSQPYSYKHDFNRHCLNKHGVMLKKRKVYVMNEEVLKAERNLMKTIAQNIDGVITEDIAKHFEGPWGYQALAHAVKAIESRAVPLNF